jgi:hypothetical protein
MPACGFIRVEVQAELSGERVKKSFSQRKHKAFY